LGAATAQGASLSNSLIALVVDEKSGAVSSLKWKERDTELVIGKPDWMNGYLYVAGRDPKDPQPNGPAMISVKERGPLVASVLVESDAPGCNKLARELRVIDGLSRVTSSTLSTRRTSTIRKRCIWPSASMFPAA